MREDASIYLMFLIFMEGRKGKGRRRNWAYYGGMNFRDAVFSFSPHLFSPTHLLKLRAQIKRFVSETVKTVP